MIVISRFSDLSYNLICEGFYHHSHHSFFSFSVHTSLRYREEMTEPLVFIALGLVSCVGSVDSSAF